MKRVKNFWTTLGALALALILVVGSLHFSVLLPAKAAVTPGPFELTGVKIQDTVSYGREIAVPFFNEAPFNVYAYDVVVKAPNGSTLVDTSAENCNNLDEVKSYLDGLPTGKGVTVAGNNFTVKADQIGVYTVQYLRPETNGSDAKTLDYTFNVRCRLDDELEMLVLKDARIPSVVATGENRDDMPGFYQAGAAAEDVKRDSLVKVGFYDDKGKWVDYSGFNVIDDLAVYSSVNERAIDRTVAYEFSTPGSVFFTYVAAIQGGTKILSKSFEVKVQTGFRDDKAPEMTISDVARTASVNQKFTVPKATVTDYFDKNPEVITTVKFKDAEGKFVDVPQVKVDKNDIVKEVLTQPEVFDNDKNMTFYPTKNGDYRITYKAADDSKNTTAEWNYDLTVSDKKAPVMTVDDAFFPEKWAYKKVKRLTDNDPTKEIIELENGFNSSVYDKDADAIKIVVPMPDFYDNLDDPEDITVRLTVKNPGNDTILDFRDINKAVGADSTKAKMIIGKSADDGTNYRDDIEFEFNKDKKVAFNGKQVNGILFGFAQYAELEELVKNPRQVEGNYTFTYTATDTAGNSATKSVTVAVSEEFEDTGKVAVAFNDVTDYVLVDGETEFTLPTPDITSITTDAKKMYVEYYIKSGNKNIGATDELQDGYTDFKGGETLKFVVENDDTYLTYEDADEVEHSLKIENNEIELSVKAVSAAGNELPTNAATTIAVRTVGGAAGKLFTGVDMTHISLAGLPYDAGTIKLGDTSYIKVTAPTADIDFIGVELGVRNSDGNYLPSLSAEFYNVAKSDGVTSERYVRNIEFEVGSAGDYIFEARVFDINGNNSVYAYPFSVVGSDSGNINSALPSTGDLYKKVTLANKSFTIDSKKLLPLEYGEAKDYVLSTSHTVKAGRFSLMGLELTAMSEAYAQVIDKPIVLDSDDNGDRYEDLDLVAKMGSANAANAAIADKHLKSFIQADQYVNFTYSAAVKFELQAPMPTYSPKKSGSSGFEMIILPEVAGFTDNVRADEIKVEVSNPDGKDIGSDLKKVADSENKYSFTPKLDGAYKVTYTVKKGSLKETFSFDIKVGDVIAPSFTLSGTHDKSVKVNTELKYKVITLSSQDDINAIGDITFTKTVIGPDGEAISTSVVNGVGKTYADRELPSSGAVKLEKAGNTYTVRYEAKDKAGNTFTINEEISVLGGNSGGGISFAVLSAILIIVGVLLIVGVVFYLVRYRSFKTAVGAKKKGSTGADSGK